MIAAPIPVEPFHDPRYPQAPEHRCESRILAPCASCRRAYPLCDLPTAAVGQIVEQRWRCADCEAAHA